jgi:hypothetical protein
MTRKILKITIIANLSADLHALFYSLSAGIMPMMALLKITANVIIPT